MQGQNWIIPKFKNTNNYSTHLGFLLVCVVEVENLLFTRTMIPAEV